MTQERSYTVKEIDDLRRVCEDRYLYGSSVLPDGGSSDCYRESDKLVAVEQMVRTAMMAGHVAQNFIDEDQRKIDEWNKRIAEATVKRTGN